MPSTLLIDSLLIVSQFVPVYFVLNDIFVRLCVLRVIQSRPTPETIERFGAKKFPFYLVLIDLRRHLAIQRKPADRLDLRVYAEIVLLLLVFGLPYLALLSGGLRQQDTGLILFSLTGVILVFGGLIAAYIKARRLAS
jgi:hypothetical protein